MTSLQATTHDIAVLDKQAIQVFAVGRSQNPAPVGPSSMLAGVKHQRQHLNPGMNHSLTSTAVLVERYRDGDDDARDELLERYLPLLRRWAHGRLPSYARSTAETDDLVQVTLQRAIGQLGNFEVRHEGAFLAYLRRIFLNTVRDEIRRYGRSPHVVEVEDNLSDGEPSAIEQILGKQKLERYEAALAALPEEHRQAVILRVEFDMSFEEIARALDRPSANTARMTVTRALQKLADQLDV